jgi:hypothetical protein
MPKPSPPKKKTHNARAENPRNHAKPAKLAKTRETRKRRKSAKTRNPKNSAEFRRIPRKSTTKKTPTP